MENPLKPLPKADLEEILSLGEIFFETFKGQHLFITGGTGFFGKWLMQGLLAANEQFNLGLFFTLLTRNPEKVLFEQPWLTHHSVQLVQGDVKDFSNLNNHQSLTTRPIDGIIHAAVEASAALNEQSPLVMFDTNLLGMRNILEFAKKFEIKKVLLTSSGAVYGAYTAADGPMKETDLRAPDPYHPQAAYGEGKRVAELMGAIWARETNHIFLVARCFAFVAPYLPLDSHFAAGNFVKAALDKAPIVIQGDGLPLRSLMYGVDMVRWLLTIYARGENARPYNVGSNDVISIKEMAELTLKASVDLKIKTNEIDIKKPKAVAPSLNEIPSYTPHIQRAQKELHLDITITTEESLKRTIAFYGT